MKWNPRLLMVVLAVVYFEAGAVAVLGQAPAKAHGEESNGNPLVLRKPNDQAPCRFLAEYRRIRENKTDVRVAYLELDQLANGDQKQGFDDTCRYITDQTRDTTAYFDKAGGYLRVDWSVGFLSDTLGYFSGKERGSGGVVLYSKQIDTHNKAFVFGYRGGHWEDLTSQYLGPVHLGANDYVMVPEYGRTARVLTPEADGAGGFQHKLWLRWDGERFAAVKQNPADWRCPHPYSDFPAEQRKQFCE